MRGSLALMVVAACGQARPRDPPPSDAATSTGWATIGTSSGGPAHVTCPLRFHPAGEPPR